MGKHKNRHKQQPSRPNVPPAAQVEDPETDVKEDTETLKPGNVDGRQKSGMTYRFRRLIQKPSVTDWCIAAFTGVLVLVAYLQFKITVGQLAVMHTDQRAWVEFVDAPANGTDEDREVHFLPGSPVSFPLELKNLGKTPALNVVAHFYIDILDASQSPDFQDVEQVTGGHWLLISGTGLMPSNGDFKEKITRYGVGNAPRPATSQESEKMEDGTAYLTVYGMLKYDDVFHVHHWTKFCSFYTKNTRLGGTNSVPCAVFNSVDNN